MRAMTLVGLTTVLLGAGGCVSGRLPAPASTQFGRAEGIVRVVNGTTDAYRMALVSNGTVFELGTVPAQESRDFAVTARILRDHSQFFLVALTRAQSGRRESEQFPLDRGNTIRWVLDAGLGRAVSVG